MFGFCSLKYFKNTLCNIGFCFVLNFWPCFYLICSNFFVFGTLVYLVSMQFESYCSFHNGVDKRINIDTWFYRKFLEVLRTCANNGCFLLLAVPFWVKIIDELVCQHFIQHKETYDHFMQISEHKYACDTGFPFYIIVA